MKRTILSRAFIYLLIVITICEILNYTTPAETVLYQEDRIQWVDSQKDKIQSLTFGRSHGGSLDYKNWDYYGKNLSLGGQDIASMKYTLDYLLPRLPNLKEVLVCVSYSSLYYDNEALSNGGLNDARKGLYASIPSYKLVSASDYNNMVFGKLFSFIQADYGFLKLVNLFNKKKSTREKTEKEPVLDSVKILKVAELQAFDHSKDKKLATQYNPDIRDQYMEYLKQIALELKAKNIKCTFYTPPFYKAYTKYYPVQDIQETRNCMAKICKETGTIYYDFSHYQKMANDITIYANSDHLNQSGKAAFSKMFDAVLRDKVSADSLRGTLVIK